MDWIDVAWGHSRNHLCMSTFRQSSAPLRETTEPLIRSHAWLIRVKAKCILGEHPFLSRFLAHLLSFSSMSSSSALARSRSFVARLMSCTPRHRTKHSGLQAKDQHLSYITAKTCKPNKLLKHKCSCFAAIYSFDKAWKAAWSCSNIFDCTGRFGFICACIVVV